MVIASDIPPFKEIIVDNYNGFLFESKNYIALAGTIENVLINYNKLNYIKQNARKTIIEKFNYKSMVKQYDKLYSLT
jgi:glycosyltransferase involved in cell wall biosynthesis